MAIRQTPEAAAIPTRLDLGNTSLDMSTTEPVMQY